MALKKFFDSIAVLKKGALRLYESASTNYVGISAPQSLSDNVNLVLPDSAGSSGQVLATDGNGNLSWQSPISPGSINLDDLEDVNAASPNDQDVLAWDDGAEEWVAQAPASSGANTNLSNLASPTAVNRDLIGNTGAAWVIKSKNDAITSSKDLRVTSGDSATVDSGTLILASGAASLISGDIQVITGTGATRGDILLDSARVNVREQMFFQQDFDDAYYASTLAAIVADSEADNDGETLMIRTTDKTTDEASYYITIHTGDNSAATTGGSKTGGLDFSSGGVSAGSGLSGQIDIYSGSTVNGNSGQVNVISGGSTNAASGAVQLSSSGGATASGNVSVMSGAASSGDSGNVNISTGNASDDSGNINLSTGTAADVRGAITMSALYLALPQGTVDPTAPAGSVYFNTGSGKLRLFDGSIWADLN